MSVVIGSISFSRALGANSPTAPSTMSTRSNRLPQARPGFKLGNVDIVDQPQQRLGTSTHKRAVACSDRAPFAATARSSRGCRSSAYGFRDMFAGNRTLPDSRPRLHRAAGSVVIAAVCEAFGRPASDVDLARRAPRRPISVMSVRPDRRRWCVLDPDARCHRCNCRSIAVAGAMPFHVAADPAFGVVADIVDAACDAAASSRKASRRKCSTRCG